MANILYTIDQLAGTARNPAISSLYRKCWNDEVGFRAEDEAKLATYRSIYRRLGKRKRPRPTIHRPLGSLLVPPEMNRYELFTSSYLKGVDEEATYELFHTLAKVKEEDVKKLRLVVKHFKGRFEKLWIKRKRSLEKLAQELAQRALVGRLGPFLDEVANFYRAPINDKTIFVNVLWAPPRVAHAATYGNHMVIPVPHEAQWDDKFIISRLGVIAHEVSHHLLSTISAELKERITTEFVERCGLLRTKHINILDEALQTALGNGLFLEKNFPRHFRKKGSWYAFEAEYDFPYAIDEYAKKLFPSLKSSLATGEAFYPTYFRKACEVYEQTFPLRPKDFCSVSLVVGNRESSRLFKSTIKGRSRWFYTLDKLDVAGKDLMECPGRTVIFLLLAEDLKHVDMNKLAGIPVKKLEPILEKHPSALITARRQERGYIFLFLAKDSWELRKQLINFYNLQVIPEQPIYGR